MEGVEALLFNITIHIQGVLRSFLILYTGVYTIIVGNLRIRTTYTYSLHNILHPDKIPTYLVETPAAILNRSFLIMWTMAVGVLLMEFLNGTAESK